jgi:uncharacterized protein DUF4402
MTKTCFFRFAVAVLLLTGLIAQRAPTAQAASAIGTSSAEMVTPLVIIFQTPLDFGEFTVGSGGGDIDVSPDLASGPPNKSTTGDVAWLNPNTAGRGSFGLQGGPNQTYQNAGSAPSVTLIGSGTALGSSMTASLTYYSDENNALVTGVGGGLLDNTGFDVLGVGGVLTVDPNQTPGPYSGTFNVTIDY